MRRLFVLFSLGFSLAIVLGWLGVCVWYLIGRLGDWLLGE